MTAIDHPTAYDRHHRPLPGGGLTCQQPGCTHINRRPEPLPRDLTQQQLDIGQQPPTPATEHTPDPAPS